MSEFPSPSNFRRLLLTNTMFDFFEDEQTEHFSRRNELCHMKDNDRDIPPNIILRKLWICSVLLGAASEGGPLYCICFTATEFWILQLHNFVIFFHIN